MPEDRFERFIASLKEIGITKISDHITPEILEKFDKENEDIVSKSGLSKEQKEALRIELQNDPGVGALEIIAHSCIGYPVTERALDLKITLTPYLSVLMINEIRYIYGHCPKELLLAPDARLSLEYLKAIIRYIQVIESDLNGGGQIQI